MIRNIDDLAKQLDTTVDGLEKLIYKSTECGAWIKIGYNGITLGSIVEGSDAETQTYELQYPFTMDMFWNTLGEIEAEADMIWQEVNEEY